MGKVFGVIWKAIKGFALFWVDFVIGDSPEIAIGVLLILGLAFLLHNSAILAAVIIPAATILLLVFSLWYGKNR